MKALALAAALTFAPSVAPLAKRTTVGCERRLRRAPEACGFEPAGSCLCPHRRWKEAHEGVA